MKIYLSGLRSCRRSQWGEGAVRVLSASGLLTGLALADKSEAAGFENTIPVWDLQARVVATGLPGVAGVRQVGRFNTGGPFPSNPEFLLATEAGQVLDPERLLVAVTSNFGAIPNDHGGMEGSILSIDPREDGKNSFPLAIPRTFATSGGKRERLTARFKSIQAKPKNSKIAGIIPVRKRLDMFHHPVHAISRLITLSAVPGLQMHHMAPMVLEV